jgi:methionyl-tRNA formyltransferase
MAWAEWMRSNQPSPAAQSISSNQDLLQLIQALKPRQVFLFRAGLIINRQVIGAGADILNVHCAKVPEYGGLGSIARALADKAYEQHATLHRVTARIDEGEVLAVEPYRLDARLSYRRNEEIAYEAGIRLLTRELGGP